jgi:hypothetical protein
MTHEASIAEIFYYIAQRHPELLKNLPLRDTVFSNPNMELTHIGTFNYSKDLKCDLAHLCEKYGSDKGAITSSGHPYPWPPHTYSDYYKRIWGHCREKVKKVFECGIGTNNPNLPSSMGIAGKPGASLRVWRDYFPNAFIYGSDIDKSVLFSENRIRTYYIDQLNPDAILHCWNEIGEEDFDFMVDDGLHTFEAGTCLFMNSISRLSRYGIYVIEDVNQADLIKYRDFFNPKAYIVDYVSLYRPNVGLGDNNLVVVRRP